MMRAWTTIVAHALERCGAADPGRAAAVAEDFATRRRAVMTLFPEAHDVLRALRARGLPLALVTNGDAREQRAKIERHALAPFFDAILIEGEMGVGKPEAVVYRRALDALGCPGRTRGVDGGRPPGVRRRGLPAGGAPSRVDRSTRRGAAAGLGRAARSNPTDARSVDACYRGAMRPVRLAIWLATAFFVVMLFLPLVREMFERLSVSNSSNLP